MEESAITGNRVSEKILTDFGICTQSLLLSLAKSLAKRRTVCFVKEEINPKRRYNYLKES